MRASSAGRPWSASRDGSGAAAARGAAAIVDAAVAEMGAASRVTVCTSVLSRNSVGRVTATRYRSPELPAGSRRQVLAS